MKIGHTMSSISKMASAAGKLLAGALALVIVALPQTAEAQWARASGGNYTNEYLDANGIAWRAHVFTNTGTSQLTVTTAGDLEYLVVAGGGAGGRVRGGGGGAGGMLTGTVAVVVGNTNVVVGAGGLGNTGTGKGGDSSFATIIATGGGNGGRHPVTAAAGSGGSGGGGGGFSSTSAGLGTSGQGFDGGTGSTATGPGAGGGGGSGGVGESTSSQNAGNGGNGLQSPIAAGTNTYYSGGGGGMREWTTASGGTGGLGGGGRGGIENSATNPENGTSNTGGGGGGGRSTGNGGNGGSGIVVVRYQIPAPRMRVMLDGTEIGDGTINFFPRALVDQSVSRTYTVTNLSDATLNLVLTNAPDAVVFANGTMSENGFTITSNITGDSTNLVPGASASFTVNFQSSEVGEKSATIKIFNSNPVTPLYSFEVMAIVGEYAWVTNSSGNWSTNANWSGGFIPNNAGVVVNFTNNITAARSVTNDTISRTVGTLNIGDANNTHGFTLAAGSGTSLTLDNWGAGAAINETGSVVDTISAPLILAENLTCTAAGSLTISGIIAETNGVRSLTKAGSGTLTLSSSGNTYTGPTTVSAGTLAMTTANRISSSSKISIGGGSTFAYSSGADSSFFLASGQAVEGTGTGVATFNTGNNSGNGLVTVDNNTFSHTGSGTLKFQRLDIRGMNNMLTGGNVEAGVSSSRRGLLVGNTSAGTFTLSAGTFTSLGEISTFSDVIGVNGVLGTFNISGGNYVNAGLLAFGIGTTAHRGGTLNINSGTATIGTLLYDSSTATGNQGIVNLNGGTLTVGTVTYASGTTREFNFNGGQLVANGNLTFSSSLTHNVKSGGAKIDTSDKTVTVNGALVNSGNGGGLTKTGSGTLVLAGENTYTGLTTIATGTLKLAKTNAIHDASAFVLGAATLDADIYTDTVGTLDVTAAATINLGSGGALVFADSSGVNNGTWAGTLNIIGTFVPGSSIKFGSNSGALTSAQLSRISVNNSVAGAYTLNAGGYLISKGTLFMFF